MKKFDHDSIRNNCYDVAEYINEVLSDLVRALGAYYSDDAHGCYSEIASSIEGLKNALNEWFIDDEEDKERKLYEELKKKFESEDNS